MSGRAWFNSCAVTAIFAALVYGFVTDNGPLLILGFIAGLVWLWGVEVWSPWRSYRDEVWLP